MKNVPFEAKQFGDLIGTTANVKRLKCTFGCDWLNSQLANGSCVTIPPFRLGYLYWRAQGVRSKTPSENDLPNGFDPKTTMATIGL